MRGRLRLAAALLGLVASLGFACGPRPAAWPAAPPAIARGPIVLVTLESLRADFVGGLGGEAGNTPILDDFIARARASGGWAGRAVAPSSWTSPVLASLLTGLSSWQHEVLHAGRNQLDPAVPTLAEALGSGGWPTHAFAAGRRLSPRSGLGRGFATTSPVRDEGRRLAAIHLRESAPGRQFVWVHLSKPDSLFERHRTKGFTTERLASEYRSYVRWLDEEIGVLLAALDTAGLGDSALVAVVACTGQDLDDPGPRGTGGHLERSLIEVPLVLALPSGGGRPLAVPPDTRVGTVRLAATLLEAAGLTPTPAQAPSLFASGASPVISELYAAGGANQFSLVAGDLQLLRRVPLADPRATSAEVQQRFQVTLPITGGGTWQDRLLRWPAARGSEAVTDAAALARLGPELERTWLAFLERERTPVSERWAARTR